MTGHIAAALLLCLPVFLARPQQTAVRSVGQAEQAPSFRSESELVVLHITVRDQRGEYVNGLPPDAFRLFDNSRPQEIAFFTYQEDPVTIGLVIDASGSMQASRARLAFAASQFAHDGRPDDEIFALIVGDETRAALPAHAPFTSSPAILQDALARSFRPGGRTALHDAIADGLDYLERGSHARRALVIVSDGIDNASETTFDDVMMRTQASNAAVYAIVLADPVQLRRDPGRLKKLARASGGDAYFPKDHADTYRAMEQVAREIRNAYAVGFVPAGPHDGRYHRLRVSVAPPDGATLDVRARAGYLAGR
jgi:Ca-activated chloride channel homolog